MKVTALAPWFGSKRTLASTIIRQLGPHKAYWEPFCGSMAVLLAKPASSFEVVNDLHGDLTNLAWVIRHPHYGARLYRRLRRTLFSESSFRDSQRSLDSLPLPEREIELESRLAEEYTERAFHYFVLCWMGRSGMLGTKSYNNVFTIRYTANGGNQATRFTSAVQSIPQWRQRMRTVTILRRDGLALLERMTDEVGTALYCDPPYLLKNAAYQHDFTHDEHERLAFLLSRFCRTRVVVSYYRHPRLKELYPDWDQLDCSRAKHLSVQGRRGSHGTQAPEVLLVNSHFTGVFLV